jgi:DNA invertase Pin-like site-specific DNA recombinase
MPGHLDQNDVVSLLRKEIKQAGGQSAWSRKTGIHRSTVNRVLRGLLQPTKEMINTLNLRVVYVRRAAPRSRGLKE